MTITTTFPTEKIPDFNILETSLPENTTLPTFMVSRDRGFLPRQEPLEHLPAEFEPLDDILRKMPCLKADGTPGLLGEGKLGETVKTFPNLIEHVEKFKDNQLVLAALYRDYSFLASAYLLEPCHHEYLRTGDGYGLGRDILPANIAMPIKKVADLTGFKPFMEYAGSYALANYRLLDPSQPLHYDNLALIRAFEHGLDRTSSEAGFVLVHVDMVRHTGPLVSGAHSAILAASSKDRALFNDGLRSMITAMRTINKTMDDMWKKSKPNDYTSFRTFIFGITSQSMFPQGVLYEGVSSERMSFRGESGANDSIIPLCDNMLQIVMPDTPLTKILEDFRQYRPGNHRQCLEWVAMKARAVGTRGYAMEDAESSTLFLELADQVREFRWRHWCFTREYILKKTTHPTATGGSPIVKWLPNQLFAVLKLEKEILEHLEGLNAKSSVIADIRDIVERQSHTLDKEVKKFCQERGVN